MDTRVGLIPNGIKTRETEKAMGNKYFTFVALAAAALATSCSSYDLAEQEQKQSKPQTVVLTASLNGDKSAATRVGMTKGNDSMASFYWHNGEAILVQTMSGDTYSGVKFTTSAETGDTTATFTGPVASGSTVAAYAVYPYSESHEFTSATDLTYNLPAEYTYNKVESNIFSKTTDDNSTYPENSTNIPLVGKIEDGKIAFKHIGGLAVIRIDKMPATSGTLTITANEQLSGGFSADCSAEEPTMTTATSSDNNTVTFKFSNAAQDEAGVFYLPLATGSYSGVKMEIVCGTTNSTVNYGNIEVARASVTAVALYNNSGNIVKIDKSCTINGHWFVDLALPSGLLWAETNIGAESATDDGYYFAWGEAEITTKSACNWGTYKYGTSASDITKYNTTDGLTTLENADDAAYVNWGSSCRMPTKAEFGELNSDENCVWTLTSQTNSSGTEVQGYRVTSVRNGNSIFLPASGQYWMYGLILHGTYGRYWSSSLDATSKNRTSAYQLVFDDDDSHWSSSVATRYAGNTVRPVAKP